MTLYKNTILGLFLSLTVLYYFLRFQWGWDFYVVGAQVSMLVLLAFFGVVAFLYDGNLKTSQDTVYAVIVLYSVLLLSLTYFRGGMFALEYGAKDYVLPVVLLLAYRKMVSYESRYTVFYIIAVLGFAVASIYLLEFISKFVLHDGYFAYTEGIRALSEQKGFTGIAQSGFSQGADSFIRMPGPISHSSSTGLMIAVGLLAALPLQKSSSSIFPKVLIAMSLLGLILTGARTAWIACFFGYVYYRHQRLSFLIVPLAFITIIISSLVVYNPAVLELINVERFLNTLRDILIKADVLEWNKIYNIFVGSGFNYPGMLNAEELMFRPILEDDLFILQFVTIYGLIPVILFVYYLFFYNPNKSKVVKGDVFLLAGKGILICFLITMFHTNALVRPQLFPVFILFVVVVDQIMNFYRSGYSRG